jgi:hypothetical protein
VSENRMLRRVFGPKTEEVAGGWRKLRNEELHNLYVSQNLVRLVESYRLRWRGYVARTTGEIRNEYKILVGKPEGKRPFGRDEKMLQWILGKEWEGVDWMYLA